MEQSGPYWIRNNQTCTAVEFNPAFLESGINIYEVMKIIDGTPLFLEDHLKRFNASLECSGIDYRPTPEAISPLIRNLFASNNAKAGNVKLVYHLDPDRKEEYLAIYQTSHFYPAEHLYHSGVSLTILREERHDPNIKNWNSGLKQRIAGIRQQKQVYEVLLMNREGFITEGSQSNFYLIRDHSVITAPSDMVLVGITRKYTEILCRQLNIPFLEKPLRKEDLKTADSAFLSGTSPGILPVSKIDDLDYNPQNELVRKLILAYDSFVREYISKNQMSSL